MFSVIYSTENETSTVLQMFRTTPMFDDVERIDITRDKFLNKNLLNVKFVIRTKDRLSHQFYQIANYKGTFISKNWNKIDNRPQPENIFRKHPGIEKVSIITDHHSVTILFSVNESEFDIKSLKTYLETAKDLAHISKKINKNTTAPSSLPEIKGIFTKKRTVDSTGDAQFDHYLRFDSPFRTVINRSMKCSAKKDRISIKPTTGVFKKMIWKLPTNVREIIQTKEHSARLSFVAIGRFYDIDESPPYWLTIRKLTSTKDFDIQNPFKLIQIKSNQKIIVEQLKKTHLWVEKLYRLHQLFAPIRVEKNEQRAIKLSFSHCLCENDIDLAYEISNELGWKLELMWV